VTSISSIFKKLVVFFHESLKMTYWNRLSASGFVDTKRFGSKYLTSEKTMSGTKELVPWSVACIWLRNFISKIAT